MEQKGYVKGGWLLGVDFLDASETHEPGKVSDEFSTHIEISRPVAGFPVANRHTRPRSVETQKAVKRTT